MTEQNNTRQNLEPYTLALLAAVAVLYTGDIYRSVFTGLLVAALIYGYQSEKIFALYGWLERGFKLLVSRFQAAKQEPIEPEPHEVYLGQLSDTKEHVFSTLQELGSFGVFAQTGSGKTSFLHSLLHWLLQYNTQAELKLIVCDLKDGLDFRIYRRLPHLLFPIATNTDEAQVIITGLLEEMAKRTTLFKAIPEDRLCNSLADYHRLKEQLLLHHLPTLPHVLAIFDEFQNITLENEAALNQLVKLAKEGRAFGISIICSTQLPNVEALPTKLKSQFTSMFCGYMANPSHYYKIVETVKEYWEPFHKAGKVPGRFIASIAGEIITLQAPWVARRELERVAREWSEGRTEPDMPEVKTPIQGDKRIAWYGTNEEKRSMLIEWFSGFSEAPTVEEFLEKFDSSRRTYFNWVMPMWDEIKG